MLNIQNSNNKVLISIISIISYLKFEFYGKFNYKFPILNNESTIGFGWSSRINFNPKLRNSRIKQYLIRAGEIGHDSVSLRFKNSDQDWPSVDLLIYEKIWL